MTRLALSFLLVLGSWTAFGQKRSDADLFTEARIAIDKFKDCPAAVKALNEVSDAGKRDPIWIYYAAKSSECANNLVESLKQYRQYNQLSPGHAEIIDKIGELEYRLRKQRESDSAAEQQRQDAARKEETAKMQLTRSLNRVAGSWSQEGNVSPVYFNDYCSARRHEERTLDIDQFASGALETSGQYRIRVRVQADGDNPSGCDRMDGVNMRRDEWEQARSYTVKLTCGREDNSPCHGELQQTNCSGDGCARSQNYVSITLRRLGSQISITNGSGTYVMSR